MQIVIDEANKKDIEQIYQIEKSSFADPWSMDLFYKDIVENEISKYFVAKNDQGQVVGFAGMYTVLDESHITNVAVKPECRKCGIGSMLVEKLIEEAKERNCFGLTLEVRVSNEAATNTYLKFGFEIAGIRAKYYQNNNEDAYIMWLYFS